jgi:hypothetical protein
VAFGDQHVEGLFLWRVHSAYSSLISPLIPKVFGHPQGRGDAGEHPR